MVASAEITQVDGVINLVYDESALPDKEGWSTLLEIVSGRVYLTRKDDKGNVAEKILFEKKFSKQIRHGYSYGRSRYICRNG